MAKAKCDHITAATSGNLITFPLRSSPPAPLGEGGAIPSSPGSFAPTIEATAAIWASHRRQHAAQVIQLPQRQAEAFRAPGEASPAQPPRFPYKPPANTPPRRKPRPPRKAADGAQASPQRNHAPTPPTPRAPSGTHAQTDMRAVEKARLIADLAEAWGVDLRLVLTVAQQRPNVAKEG